MNRNTLYILALFCLSIAYCKTPMPITFNPDDQSNANGTIGSAKQTNQLPPKSDNMRMKFDTIKLPKDTVRTKQ
jgi:hypothetical protein